MLSGKGLELALACDVRFAAQNAHFGLPGNRGGFDPFRRRHAKITPDVGRGKALEMILTGKRLTPPEALENGLVTKNSAPLNH